MSLAVNLVWMLALLGVGVTARALGVLTPACTNYLTDFAFYVALPALVFNSTATTNLRDVLSIAVVVGVVAAVLAVAAAAWVVHRRVSLPTTRSVAIVQSYHSNFGFLGLPIVAVTFGSVAAAKASLLLGAGALIQIPLTVALLGTMNDANTDLRTALRGVARNPVIAALVVGIAFAGLGIGVPSQVSVALGWVSTLALPAALLSVGASLVLDTARVDARTVAGVVTLKVVVMPLVGAAVFTLLGADPTTLRTGTMMLAMPTAVSTFVYATQLGGDETLASTNVFVTTVVSLAAVSAALSILG